MERFRDRSDAGRRLARVLMELKNSDPLILALPRGGVPVAYEVAVALCAPLDILIVRKLGVPFQPELAMGAIGEDEVLVVDERVVADARITAPEFWAVEYTERQELELRVRRFRGGRPPLSLERRTVIIVDDGIATGSTARAACQLARARGAQRVILAVPVAIISTRRRCPELPLLRFADLMAPVLMACWGMGRLLGPQLMVNGGGHPTHQWFGMYYAGDHPNQKVLPVPIFQAMEDFAIFGVLLLVERWLRNRAPRVASDGSSIPEGRAPLAPAGIVLGVGMILWGIERFLDEHLWLGEDGHLGSLLVQIAGVALAIAGVILLASRLGPYRRWRDSRPDPVDDPEPEPTGDGADTAETGRGGPVDDVVSATTSPDATDAD